MAFKKASDKEEIGLFQWSDSISWHKVDLMTQNNEHNYDIFMAQRHLGMSNEFINIVDFTNAEDFRDKYMHYQFLRTCVQKPSRKPFIKFIKAEKVTDEIKMISEYFNVNKIVAADYMKRLTEDQLDEIKSRLNPDEGGKEKLERKKRR